MAKNRSSVDTPLYALTLVRPMVLLVIIAGVIFGLPDTSRGTRNQTHRKSATGSGIIHWHRTPTILMAAEENSRERSTPREGTTTNKRNVERWQALPSDKKKELRNRMDQWRNLSPRDQDKYRHRYQKLQELTPGQRKKIDQSLEKWDTLSPTEKEEIRQQFEE